jgi:hypothetical protein
MLGAFRKTGNARFLRIALILLYAGTASAETQPAGVLTLMEGKVELIRGAALYSAAPGMGLRDGDILTVGPKGQAQVEFRDGNIVNFSQGANARLDGISANSAARARPVVTVLSGWVKLDQSKSKGVAWRYATPVAEFVSAKATAVFNADRDRTASLFIESGAAKVSEPQRRGSRLGSRDAKAGDFVSRKSGQAFVFAGRPAPEFVKGMPGYFRDNLPVLLDRLRNRNVEPRFEHEVSYVEIEDWLKADYPIRKSMLERFENRARDPDFRRKLVENLPQHPEWDRVLHPEKYQPKQADNPKTQTPAGAPK